MSLSAEAAQTGADTAITPLGQNRSFSGILSTQFLGAFNDNFFKQMVLLKCTELATQPGRDDLQGLATAAFALPFVLLSGFGGYISDRVSKRSVVVWCKVAEIAVMAASLSVLTLRNVTDVGQLQLLIGVLAFMGAQSAIFGPSKYGILPELFHSKQLLPVNGSIQMTTFLAIIFGMAGAGIALDNLNNSLWLCSMIAVFIAVAGTFTALIVKRTPVARPNLEFQPGNLFVPQDIRRLFRRQPTIFRATLVMMVFWFIGGVAHPAVNRLGEHVLYLTKTRTSLLAASIGVGIAVGCVVSGFLNRSDTTAGARWTKRGSWMLAASLLFIAVLSSGAFGRPTPRLEIDGVVVTEGIVASIVYADGVEWLLRLSMLGLGLSAGIFVVPVQVYIQDAPPAELKGRMIGAMNFMTWVGILLSSGYLVLLSTIGRLLNHANPHQYDFLIFGSLGILMIPLAILYRLPNARPRSDDDPAQLASAGHAIMSDATSEHTSPYKPPQS